MHDSNIPHGIQTNMAEQSRLYEVALRRIAELEQELQEERDTATADSALSNVAYLAQRDRVKVLENGWVSDELLGDLMEGCHAGLQSGYYNWPCTLEEAKKVLDKR